MVLVMDKKHAGTLTVGFKCQAEAGALIRSIRDKVNEEMIVGSLKEGWRTGATEPRPQQRRRSIWTVSDLQGQ